MAKARRRRFVTRREMKVERLPWGPHDWLCRPDIVEAEELLLVRVHMPRGKAHKFHVHPTMEEIIYVLEGKAEQWVDREMRILGPGEIAHIPMNVVHGTYNAGRGVLRFLAILGPARFKGPALVDMSEFEPWKNLREKRGLLKVKAARKRRSLAAAR
jgi:quercetin dioxygenase-like cupin family protein